MSTPKTYIKVLQEAADDNIITADQSLALAERFASSDAPDSPRFAFGHVLYYLGGALAIAAMTLFMTAGWESFGGIGVFFIALFYVAVGLFLAKRFENAKLALPAGILAAFSVATVPLALFGIQHYFGVWPEDTRYVDYHRYIKWHWIYLELGTLVIGAVIFYRFRYPFVLMPLAATLWYLSMDLGAFVTQDYHDFEFRALVSMYFGLLFIGLAVWIDSRDFARRDYAFWMYLFGVVTFWGGLTSQNSDSELAKLLYCCVNFLMIFIGLLLNRKVFVIFGGLGVAAYLGHLAFNVFDGSFFFPIAVTLIGLGIVYLGIYWQKHEDQLTIKARSMLPRSVANFFKRIDHNY